MSSDLHTHTEKKTEIWTERNREIDRIGGKRKGKMGFCHCKVQTQLQDPMTSITRTKGTM